MIYPAEEPHSAILSRGDERVRVTMSPGAERPSAILPAFRPEFILTRGGEAGEGRAGMHYRDLIPSRLGGRYVASHITMPAGGPVADWVHFHRVTFQLIYVQSGWARVVYEDQGDPFVMSAGDLVLQPPGIRHRVLESSPGLEVIEIGAPALHETCADHDMALPNGRIDGDRRFSGQRFLRHIAKDTPWTRFGEGEAQETAMLDATGGLADVRTIRPNGAPIIRLSPHQGELVFGFVLEGRAEMELDRGRHPLQTADAFVIPPGQAWQLDRMSDDFRLLHVTTSRLD